MKNLKDKQTLTSKAIFIQGLPLFIQIVREKKGGPRKDKRLSVLKIRLHTESQCEAWSSRITIILYTTGSESDPITFKKSIENDWENGMIQTLHTLEWEKVAELRDLRFKIEISFDRPNGGYVWKSRDATGYR